MKRESNPTIDILELTVDQLSELANEMVFLGCCATGLIFLKWPMSERRRAKILKC